MNLKTHERGSAIMVVLLVVAILTVTLGIAVEYTATTHRNVQRSTSLQNAVAIGDGALDILFGYWREVCRGKTNLTMPTNSFAAVPLPTSSQFPNISNFSATRTADSTGGHTVSNYQVQAVGTQLNVMASSAQPPAGIGQSSNSATYNYLASADVMIPALRGNLTAKVRRVFQKQQLSPWNWAIFYLDLLEIHPGPPFTVTGWVHTNGDLYTGHNTLTFADKTTYGHDWTIGFAPGDPRNPHGSGPETPGSPSWPSNLPPALDVAHQPFGLDSMRIFNNSNPNADSYHELIEQAVSGYSDPLAGSRYYDQAGVKITIDNSNTVTIRNGAGTVVNSSSTGNDLQIYQTFKSAITTNQTIQDNRETSSVRLATLDVSKITNAINNGSPTNLNFNGIVYITDTSAAANGVGAKRGIRLKNGTVMPTGGLTIASGNPVFIQGDYNTGGANPPSNSGNYSTPQVSGYTRQPSSVIADAVYILSNAWSDSNSSAGLSSRVASNTTVNTAILSGIVPSSNNVYSGGAEKFSRFLETWTGKTLTYYGSMVDLYLSKRAIGTWGKGNVYDPPNRQCCFDKTFRLYPPLGSLIVYSYVKGQ